MASKLTLNMGDAAHAASLADGVTTNGKKNVTTEKVPLRRGKWTVEEEQFSLRLIEEFRLGLLPLTDGTTLRTFLSKLLNCDPMRISKKFVGDNCIGKQVFRHASGEVNGFLSEERMEKSKRELAELERKFLDRLLTSSTTPTSSPRNLTKDSNDLAGGERKSKKAKISQKVTAAQDDRVHFKTGNDSQVPLYTGIPDSGDEDSHGGHGRDMLYSPHNQVHSLHPLQQHNPQQYQQYQQHQHQQHQHQQQHPQYSLYSQQNQQSLSTSYLPPPMYPHDAQYSYMGNGGGVGGGGGGGLGSALDSRDRDRGTSPYPPFAPPMNMNMNMGMNIHQGGGSGGVGFPPYPGVRTSSDTSTSSSGGGEGGADDWRQHMGGLGQQSRQMGPFDAQMNWHQQYLPSQQFYDQHQSQLRSMGGGGGPGSTPDQSEEGMLKAKGSFYKSIKSSSTSSLDLLGTLATSISRENLVSYGNSGDSSCNLNTLGADPSSTGSGMSSGMGISSLSRADPNSSSNSSSSNSSTFANSNTNTISSSVENLKRNSKSIQDFWMLVEMGDLSRPDQEDLGLHSTEDDVCVDSAVFDIEDDNKSSQFKSQLQSQFPSQSQVQVQVQPLPPSHGSGSGSGSSTQPHHSYQVGTGANKAGGSEGMSGGGGAGGGGGGGGGSTVSRCESAPVLSLSNTSFSPVHANANANANDANTNTNTNTTVMSSSTAQNSNININDTKHDPVVLQSLLSMASAEHLRIDHLPTPSSSYSSNSTTTTTTAACSSPSAGVLAHTDAP